MTGKSSVVWTYSDIVMVSCGTECYSVGVKVGSRSDVCMSLVLVAGLHLSSALGRFRTCSGNDGRNHFW